MCKYTYTKADRLRKRSEFIHLSEAGKKRQNRHFLALFCPGQNKVSRLGVTVTKRVGKAVTRNRIKRVIREYFRLNQEQIQQHIDINVIAKKEAANLSSEEMLSSLRRLFEKIKRDCAG